MLWPGTQIQPTCLLGEVYSSCAKYSLANVGTINHMWLFKSKYDEWINKIQYTYAKEYSSAIKGNEVLTRATNWMNLEDMISVKKARHERPHTTWLHLCEMPGIGKSVETEISGWWDCEKVEIEVTVNDNTECLWGHKNVLKVDNGGGGGGTSL